MRRAVRAVLVVVLVWGLLAYVVLPALWRHYEHAPALEGAPKVTRTGAGLPGDPLNVALVGEEAEVLHAFATAGWRRPHAIDLRSSVGIAESVLLDRPDPTAPVSNLFLFGRRQDLAFEQQVGGSARERNHVRFWRAPERAADGRPYWLGAATFDRGVGFSHTTGQVTHHIGADIDAERDRVVEDLEHARQLTTIYQVTGVGPTLRGHNGGGDPYFTDGEMTVGVLVASDAVHTGPAAREPNPPIVALKGRLWAWLRPLLRRAPLDYPRADGEEPLPPGR